VTGAVGSVTGAVGSVTGNVAGNVVGSTASVTGNVGGNVVGSVGSISGVTFPANNGVELISASGVVTAGGTIRKNIASQTYPIYLVLSTDHISPATGKTVTVSVSKDGAALGAITGTVAEIGSGWYLVSLSQADSNCNTCVYTTSAAATDARAFYFRTAP
jgi:hypothetical protein